MTNALTPIYFNKDPENSNSTFEEKIYPRLNKVTGSRGGTHGMMPEYLLAKARNNTGNGKVAVKGKAKG